MTPEALAVVIADAVAVATAPLVARIATLEQHKALVPRDGRDGAIGPQGEKGLAGEPGLPGLQGPPGEKGLTGERGVQGPQGLPGEKGLTGERGVQGPQGLPGEKGAVGPVGPAGPQGERGADGVVTQALVMETLSAQPELLETAVARYLQRHPPVAGKDGAPGRDGRDGLAGASGLPGEKGLNGKDGRDGIDGKDGRDGRDGVDGLGFDDFEEVLDVDGRSLLHIYRSGERSKEYRHTLACLLDRGIWESGKQYDAGDVVSRNGSIWIAQKQTKAMPGDASPDWRLSVKHGRDGKVGPPGPQGVKGLDGKDGRPGKDLTQMDEKGRKW